MAEFQYIFSGWLSYGENTLHGKKELILHYIKHNQSGHIHQMSDVKNGIGFVVKQQIAVQQKFYFC